jgi:hypothetical protein
MLGFWVMYKSAKEVCLALRKLTLASGDFDETNDCANSEAGP